MMTGALLFELSVPALVCTSPGVAAVLLFAFHYIVWFLFDIDFLSYWAPSLLVLAVEDTSLLKSFANSAGGGWLWSAVVASPLQTTVLLVYTATQVAISLRVYDLNPRRSELLPFSAYPMFEEATRCFQEDQAMALVLRVPT